MREIPQPKFPLEPIEDTLLTSDYLAGRKRAVSIEKVALKEAKKIIRVACQQSTDIKNKAYQEGLFNGLSCCLVNTLAYLNSVEALHAMLQKRLQDKLVAVLTNIFNDESIFLHLVQDWCKDISQNTFSEITITLPESEVKLAKYLSDKIPEKFKLEVKINYHRSSFFQLKCYDQLLEINLGEFNSGLIQRLICNNESIAKKITGLSESYAKKLNEIFK